MARIAQAFRSTVTDSKLFQGDNWNELLKEVISFDSVEEFWGIHVSYLCHNHRYRRERKALLTKSIAEQHLPYQRARTQVRLPSFQSGCAPGVGRYSEQARWKMGFPVQEQVCG